MKRVVWSAILLYDDALEAASRMRRTPKIVGASDERRHCSGGGEKSPHLGEGADTKHTHRLRAHFTHFSQIKYTVYAELQSFQSVNCRNEVCMITVHYTIKDAISGCQAVKMLAHKIHTGGRGNYYPKYEKSLQNILCCSLLIFILLALSFQPGSFVTFFQNGAHNSASFLKCYP